MDWEIPDFTTSITSILRSKLSAGEVRKGKPYPAKICVDINVEGELEMYIRKSLG